MEYPANGKRIEKEGGFNENNELVFDKKVIAFAMPKGEFSSNSSDESIDKKKRIRQRKNKREN
tara:strand:+ start:59 stop:247 length:189 start_codon:yes stop_codon:yes gene_type:complete